MFCYQCEQTAKSTSCTGKVGVCGKTEGASALQDRLTGELIMLAKVANRHQPTDRTEKLLLEGLFATLTNVNFDEQSLTGLMEEVRRERVALFADSAGCEAFDLGEIWKAPEDIRSLKSLILFGLRGMAAYSYHALVLGLRDPEVTAFIYKTLEALTNPELAADTLIPLTLEIGKMNLKVMALLDKGNTGAYGTPSPVTVPLTIEKGPFIVVTGHDLHDLKQLLEQTDGTGVQVYSHCEMLPAHAYPALKKHPQFKGNFGTAWQNQQKEFDAIPGVVLFTTNCLMPPKPSYADRIYTTAITGFPGVKHIAADGKGRKDFSALIAQAKSLGGYQKDTLLPGINGGATVTTGYGRETLLSNAGAIIDAVKAGNIAHFFLVGGCDGAKPGRNYYTEFVKQTPANTVVLTLACGKFRFNDMDIGSIGPFPRILDMGQCNDAYGAIEVAIALAKAFNCGVNELPLTLVLSWFEQKAVVILLTLLCLGIHNIYIGPSLPAFLSDPVLKVLVELFKLHPTTSPEQDLKTILGK